MPPPVPPLPEEAVEETTPAPALLEEILEQIFLRLPPDEPACLVRASLASKLWLALLTGPSFRSRYREHHGAPPMLGFLRSNPWDCMGPEKVEAVPPFVSTTRFRARVPDDGWGHRYYTAWDCRHGRVLLLEINGPEGPKMLAVWDPMTGRRRELQGPEVVYGYDYGCYAAAVLCAVSDCDHLTCQEGSFRVVFISRHKVDDDDFVVQARVSTQETRDCSKPCSWSQPCSVLVNDGRGYIKQSPPVLVNEALHFMLVRHDDDGVRYTQILKYHLSSNCLSLFDAPKVGASMGSVVLMAMEDGNLGFALLERLTIFIWSRHMGSDGVVAWNQRIVIDPKNLLPIQNYTKGIRLLGSVEGSDIIFVTTNLGIYKINLKSLQQKKVLNRDCMTYLIPYMSFYIPREKGETV